MSERVKILESKEGIPTLKINNIYIYSRYTPTNDVKVFWDNNKDKYIDGKGIVVYGLGLGYHVLELLNRVSKEFKICIFDLDEECYEKVKDIDSVKSLTQNNNVEIIVGNKKESLRAFKNRISESQNFIIIDSIFKTIPIKYVDIKNAIKDFRLANIGIERFKEKMETCNKENHEICHFDISLLIDDNKGRAKPIVLVASGPSLDENVFDALKDNRKDIIIFCVGRSLNALVRKGVYPDMFCIIDCQDFVYEQIKGMESLDISMTFLNTANNLAVKSYRGPKYMFYNEDMGQKYVIDTGKSVATAILDIAIKCLPQKIIFVGQDLAYTDGNSHSKYTKYTYDIDVNEGEYLNQVESVGGKMIPTTEGLKSFKRWIERKIESNGHIEYFNCSRGANIEGTKCIDIMGFRNLIKK